MKRKKIITVVIIAVIGIGLLAAGFTILIEKKPQNKETKKGNTLLLKDTQYENGLLLNEKKSIKICDTANENCRIKDQIYPQVYLDTQIKEVNDFIKVINNKIDEYYTKTKKANIETSSCKDLSKKGYLKDSYIPVGITSYIDDTFISISLDSRTIDLCNNKPIENPYLIGVFDKKIGKMLTQEEIATAFNITKERVYEALKQEAYDENTKQEAFKLPEITNLNYQLFLSEEGRVIAASLVSNSSNDNLYYEITLN